jgi:hypothetical protein
MRFLQAGNQKLVALEPEHEVIENLVEQAGFKCKLEEDDRRLLLELKAPASTTIRLFDASDEANRAWFASCQFYADAVSGAVLQTPLTISNCYDRQGRLTQGLRIALSKELPATFRLPGRQSVSERLVYALLYNFLLALTQSGVAICGRGGIRPLVGGGAGSVAKT